MKTDQKEHMERKPEVPSTGTTENAGLNEAKGRVRKNWKSARQFVGKSLEKVWLCGQALSEVRDQLLPRGEWVKWLESEGIPTSTAYYWMKFSKEVEFSKIWKFDTVDQAMKALKPAPPKRKKADGKVKPDAETKGEASSVEKAEVSGGDGTRQVLDDTESAQEIQELCEKLKKTEDRRRAAEKVTAELREKLRETEDELGVARKQIAELLQKNKQLNRQLEEKGTPKDTTSVDQPQIKLHRAFAVPSEHPVSDGARTTAAPVSGKTPTLEHPEIGTATPVSEGK